MRRSNVFLLTFAFLLGVVNYMVKQHVISKEKEFKAIQTEIKHLNESIHIFTAEWSYLNEPSRLQKLVESHLKASPMKGVQLVSLNKLPGRLMPSEIKADEVRLASARP